MAIAAPVMAGLLKLPRAAVPDTLEIVMQATGVDSLTLLSSLLRLVSAEIKELQNFEVETEVTEMDSQKLVTYVAALLYLLKFAAQEDDVVEEVMWTICIPLLRIENSKAAALQDEVIEMMVNTVEGLGLWRTMAMTLGRICQQTFITDTVMKEMARSTLKGEGMKEMARRGSNDEGLQEMAERTLKEPRFVSNSCQLVAALLKSAIEVTQENASTTLDIEAEYFCTEVVCKFTEPALALLSQTRQASMRHVAISILLPPILRAITMLGVSLANPIRSAMPEISRFTAAQKIWESCKILFEKGHLECRDAYEALDVFADYLLPPVQQDNESSLRQYPKKSGADYFDIRDDHFIWDQLKAGLAHDEPRVRERALNVLKRALPHSPEKLDDVNTLKFREDCNTGNIRQKRWSAFVFLHETLDKNESSHLAEGALTQMISFLLPFSKPTSGERRPWANPGVQSIAEGFDVDFKWISILFQRGFNHEIVKVRTMVFRSFLELDWERSPKVKAFVPEEFVLGPFLSAVDDPVHHQEFDQGRSDTSTLAAKFVRSYSASLSERNRELFTQRLAKAFAAKTPCRAGLLCFAICIEAATVGLITMESEFPDPSRANSSNSSAVASEDETYSELHNKPTASNEIGGDVLDNLQLFVEKTKSHVDEEYRAQVYEHILAAAAAMNRVPHVLFRRLANFILSFPRELLQQEGRLRDSLLNWLCPSRDGQGSTSPGLDAEKWLRKGLAIMMEDYLKCGKPNTESSLCEDDIRGWEETARRWTRFVAIGVISNKTQQYLVLMVERYLTEIYQRAYMVPHVAEKTLILFRCLLKECETWTCPEYQARCSPGSSSNIDEGDHFSRLAQYVADSLLNTLDVLVQNAKKSGWIFSEYHESSMFRVPLSTEARSQEIERKEGQSAITSIVMQGVLAVTTLAESCIWYCRLRSASEIPEGVINFFWDFAWNVVIQPAAKTESGAQVQLGSYEALVSVSGAWAATVSPFAISNPMAQVLEKEPFVALNPSTVVDYLVTALISNAQSLTRTGLLTKCQCEALVCYKWSSLEHLLSIPRAAVVRAKGANDPITKSESSISMSVLQDILQEAIDSLESAGEEWLVPLLHSIRWLMQWEVLLPVNPSEEAQDKSVQTMWSLVQSGWTAMAKYYYQPRVAVWAAFLGAMLHPTVFGDKEMHEAGIHEDDGPLKWLICRLLTKRDVSARATRITAIHMAGLWLHSPATLTCYVDQLKILVLLGEEVVDDVNGDARTRTGEAIEDALLWRGYGLQISETYLDTDIYPRMTIAIMLHIVAQVVEAAENSQNNDTSESAKPGAECGRKLLLDLLTYVAEESKPSEEQHPTGFSDIQKQKKILRAWQILCILSQFVSLREIDHVISLLEVAIESNNTPFSRRLIETFAVRIFLQFPSLVEKNLVTALNEGNVKAQALSSYISIAVIVVLCTSSAALRLEHLRQVLPAIFPFIMSTNPNTQVLVYHMLHRWITGCEQASPGRDDCANTDHFCLDRICLQSLVASMEANTDCMRLKPSVELFLDAFDPIFATTPQGVYCRRGWDITAEANDDPVDRVSVTVLHQIFRFLNSARKASTEECFRGKLFTPDKLKSKVHLSSSTGTKEMSSGSVSKLDDPQHFQTVLTSETHTCSEVSTKSFSCGSVDSAPGSSVDAASHSKLHPQAQSSFPKPVNTHEDKINSSPDLTLEVPRHELGDRLEVRKPRPELIVIATAPADSSELAGFARTCEVFEIARLVITKTSRIPTYQNRLTPKNPPSYEILDTSLKKYLKLKRQKGFALLGLGKGVGSVLACNYSFCDRSVLVLGGEYGVASDIVPMLDALIDVTNPDGQHPLNVFVGASIVLWEYAQEHRPPSKAAVQN